MSLLEVNRAARPGDANAPERPRHHAASWWRALLVVAAVAAGLLAVAVAADGPLVEPGTAGWWALTTVVHVPYVLILCFLLGGLVERVGYFRRGRAPTRPGPLPAELPTVCVQLPMFNEVAVAVRAIEAAGAMWWPADRLEVQVLDDSTDPDARTAVAQACARLRAAGIDCRVIHRSARDGYKAGALEAGRRLTAAELIAIFDADFVPPPDFLLQTVAHFYRPDGRPDEDLALVQAQWGHLNAAESGLTRAQSLWVDDHHTLQMSWRAAVWQFVNFTGTAGVWRAAAIEAAGGWRAASLVEDCELSFRHLFAGYRTTFVKEIVAPAELPAAYRAYKAQQRRWTRGWVQLQRLHLLRLLTRFECSPVRRLHLAYHMCISWQWPLWAGWTLLLPFAMATGLSVGATSPLTAAALYLGPSAVWVLLMAVAATVETRHTYPDRRTIGDLVRRGGRLVPYVAINSGMLPHQATAFTEGLLGEMHGEFERTPKMGATPGGAGARRPEGRTERAYVAAEGGFVVLQSAWAAVFIGRGDALAALGALYLAACVTVVAARSHVRVAA